MLDRGVVGPSHLPEGEEYHRLDEDEFEQRVEGCQHLVGAQVEHEQRKECHTVGDVVHYGDVKVPAGQRVARLGKVSVCALCVAAICTQVLFPQNDLGMVPFHSLYTYLTHARHYKWKEKTLVRLP